MKQKCLLPAPLPQPPFPATPPGWGVGGASSKVLILVEDFEDFRVHLGKSSAQGGMGG